MSSQDYIYDITIIGGGIAGLSLANALEHSGYSVVICEQAHEIKEIGAGLTLWHNAMSSFQEIGLDDQIYSIGLPFDDMAIRKASGKILKSYSIDHLDAELGNKGIGVHRAELVDTLVSSLENTSVLTSMELSHLEQNELVTSYFTNGEQIQSKILIGSDGINSKVRESITTEGTLQEPIKRYSGYAAWRGIAHLSPDEFDDYSKYIGESWGSGLRFGSLALKDNRIYWFAVHNIHEKEVKEMRQANNREDILQANLIELFNNWHYPIPELIEKVISHPSGQLLYNPIHDIEPFEHWSSGRVLLIGDAAHATTPNMGQGACMAIVDSILLAELIEKNGIANYDQIFNNFIETRVSKTHQITRQSHRIGKIGQTENRFLIFLRNLIVRHTPKRVLIKQLRKTLTRN